MWPLQYVLPAIGVIKPDARMSAIWRPVDDHQPLVATMFEQVLEGLAHCLNRERVHRSAIKRHTNVLDPNAPQDPSVVRVEQIQEVIAKANAMRRLRWFSRTIDFK